jgi:hypothetical protein
VSDVFVSYVRSDKTHVDPRRVCNSGGARTPRLADSIARCLWGDSILDAIGHIALVVGDPARTASLFRDLFNAAILLRRDPDDHEETFVRLGRTWFVLVKGVVDRPRTGDHIAFAVSRATLLESAEKLKKMNLEFFLARSDTALYFFDYDNHIFELDTTDLDGDLSESAGM